MVSRWVTWLVTQTLQVWAQSQPIFYQPLRSDNGNYECFAHDWDVVSGKGRGMLPRAGWFGRIYGTCYFFFFRSGYSSAILGESKQNVENAENPQGEPTFIFHCRGFFHAATKSFYVQHGENFRTYKNIGVEGFFRTWLIQG